MQRKESNKIKIRILAVSIIVLAIFDILIWYSVFTNDGSPVLTAQENIDKPVNINISHNILQAAVQDSIGTPVRITIPSIAVDAKIEKVELAADGSMDVPKDPFDTAWYALGPRPGEMGSAVIAGHVNWIHGQTAVFADLHKVRSGDTIVVHDDKGVATTFVVHEIRKYSAAADATDIFRSYDGKAHLNIITCDGVWNKSEKQYSERLVVFTDRVE